MFSQDFNERDLKKNKNERELLRWDSLASYAFTLSHLMWHLILYNGIQESNNNAL